MSRNSRVFTTVHDVAKTIAEIYMSRNSRMFTT